MLNFAHANGLKQEKTEAEEVAEKFKDNYKEVLKRCAKVLNDLEEYTRILAQADAHLYKSFALPARNVFRELKQKGTRYFWSKTREKELEWILKQEEWHKE